MTKFFIFVFFFLVYVLYLWLSYILTRKYVNNLRKNDFITSELIIVTSNVFLFLLVFIIGKFFNLYIILISILVSNLGLFIAFVIWNLLGGPKVPYKAIGGWVGTDLALKNKWISLVLGIFSILMLISYPITVGIHFFGNLPLNEISLFTLKATLILMLGSYLLLIPVVIVLLTSNFIDENTRSRTLITHFSGLLPNALFISILFWAFNSKSMQIENPPNIINISFNPYLFIILMLFFIFFLLLPYYIGTQRSKQLEVEYFEIKDNLLEKIIETIDLATSKTIVSKLEITEKYIKDLYSDFARNDYAIKMGLQFDEVTDVNNLTKNELFIYNYYKEARLFDKRFTLYDFIYNIYRKITSMKDNLTDETYPIDYKEVKDNYSTYFKELKKELNSDEDKQGKYTPALWLGILAILTPFIGQITAEVGKYLIEYLNLTKK